MKSLARTILTILLLLSVFPLKSQEKYQPGYIITNNGDTVRGMIRDRKQAPFGKLYKKIRFRGNSIFAKKYGPSQISAYKIGDTAFESKWINATSFLFRTNYTSDHISGNKHFLKVVVKGYLSLYQWEYMDQESWSVDAIELFKREKDDYYIRVTRGIFGLRSRSLKEYFYDCPDLIQKIDRKELKSPAEIANFYNSLMNLDKNK